MIYGINDSGFTTKPYGTLIEELYDRWRDDFGAIDTDPDGALGQIARSVSYTDAELWQIFESTVLNADIRTASGQYLDRLGALQGLPRKSATRASSPVFIGGDVGTVIPQGTTVIQSRTSKSFETLSEITLALNAVHRFDITWDGTNPIVMNINGRELTATTLDGFVEVLYSNANFIGVGRINRVSDTEISVTSYLVLSPIPISATYSGITLDRIYGLVQCRALEDGVIIVPQNTINQINIPNVTCTNPVNGSAGTLDESDSSYRARIRRLQQVGANATESAIEGKLWSNINGLSEVVVTSNRSDVVDFYGREPHSVHIVVEGGDDAAIAQQIYESIPVGIPTHGATEVNVSGSNVRFDRVNSLFGWVEITIVKKNAEGTYPANAESLIRESVFREAVNLTRLGVDIIAQKFLGGIYRNVTGLEDVRVRVGVTGTDETNPDATITPYDPTNIANYNSGWQSKVSVRPTDKVEFRDTLNPTRIIIKDEDR